MVKEIVLMLDTDRNITWTLKTILENEGYLVVIVDSVERAKKNFSEFKVSGFITEYRVDDVHTLEAIQRLKEVSPETYVMMVTDVEVKEEEYAALIQGGVDDYFLKPISAGKILLHLQKGFRDRVHGAKKKPMKEMTFAP